MRNLTTLFALVFLFALLAGLALAGDPKPAKATIYRIRVEEGVKIPPGANAADIKAIEELNALLKRWPNMLWLSNHRGKFVAMKMGPDGCPIGRGN
jgi:hypothetical protein